jgi:translation initiation factor IF-1
MIIEFTVQDNKTGRGEYDSRIQLQRIIKKTLENTNWRLMSEGVNYRLGILSGRLRGYENEEDFIKLIRA